MSNFKTPGVYIQEISTLPASVAPVATAIPAFVGYTKDHPTTKPVRITSFLDFLDQFGESHAENYSITLTGTDTDFANTTIAVANPSIGLSNYILGYQLEMFFMNGGGPCYVVSAGAYKNDGTVDKDELVAALRMLEEEDEPTILTVPEAIFLTTAGHRAEVYNEMLTQCNKLQDRFAVMDVPADSTGTVFDDGVAFRSNDVGTSYLKYGAAYYPDLKTSLIRHYEEGGLLITDDRGGAGAGPFHECPLSVLNLGSDLALGKIIITDNDVVDGDTFTVGADDYIESNHFTKGAGNATTASSLATAIGEKADYKVLERVGNVITLQAKSDTPVALGYTDSGTGVGATVSGTSLEIINPDTTLYNAIKKILDANTLDLYPCGTMAGVYARVDRDRGVWKAPANVSVNGVKEPGILVTNAEQSGLNIDSTSGKSINAIRSFAGKGVLVWGARTLAGNDNEWRYVPVRRFYNFMEESIQKATEPSVFEPNTAATWSKLKAMIENFLVQLWSAGALAGATPEDAFFVNIGLGKTMTALDILEGRLNIEVGVAAVRPAEFIILKFSHKLQES